MYEVKREILDSFCLAQNPLAAERDYIECNILNQIFQFPYFCNNFVFTGGGTISKIYHMGNRINQDIDLACFDFKEVAPTRSVGQLSKFKDRFKTSTQRHKGPKTQRKAFYWASRGGSGCLLRMTIRS